MDISALSEDKFNAAEWINSNYKAYKEENKKGAPKHNKQEDTDSAESQLALSFIQSYVSKLQLYVQQVNYAVEESSHQLVVAMPRIAKEARVLQGDVRQLQTHMRTVRQDVLAVQEETGDCMATLERLNNLQTKLKTAKESLQQSDGWGNLIAELEDCFERNELKGVCEKLIALQKSLKAQESLPGHAERQTQVEDFKNRLEALASPSVVQAFAESNIEQAQMFVNIFQGIERLPQLQQYYRAVQKNTLQQQWKQALELQTTESSTQQHQFLTLFYEQLIEFCTVQIKWCTKVFDAANADADSSLSNGEVQPLMVIAELMPSLVPTRDAHILQLLKSSNDRLDLLQQYAQANNAFAVHLNAYLEQSSITLTKELRLQLSMALYEYFFKFIQQYPRLEETQLATQVDRLIVSQATASDTVRHLEESVRKVFDWLYEACERCHVITEDLALCKFIPLLAGVFKRVLENFNKVQKQLSLNALGGANAGGGGAAMMVDTENWVRLQCAMGVLQCLAEYQNRLNKFEKALVDRLGSLASKLTDGQTSSMITIYEAVEAAEQRKVLSLISEYKQKCSEAPEDNATNRGIFPSTYTSLKSHLTETHDIALNILMAPIEAHLVNIVTTQGLANNSPVNQIEMPSFSFAPQEYITQVGQYLLTLPQHLEPLLLAPSSLLKQALEACNIKYSQDIPCADVLLSLVVEQSCILYQGQILQLKSLHATASKQLAIDIEYLSNVVEELGLTITQHLSQILTLLKASPENYLTMSSGCEPRLVTAIRQMRNIISTQ